MPTVGPPDEETIASLERQFGGGSILFGQKRPTSSSDNSQEPDSMLNKVVTEEELEEMAGRQMMLGRAIQSVQMAMRVAGKNLGPVSAKAILELADRGEIEESRAVQFIRKMVAV